MIGTFLDHVKIFYSQKWKLKEKNQVQKQL